MPSGNKRNTPKVADWLLSKFISENLLEEFYGDLLEIYDGRISTRGRVYANMMYWIDILHLIFGFASFKTFKRQNNPFVMHKHYLIVSIRNLARTKLYSFVNILSLAIGMGAALTIFQYIYFELSYDKMHDNLENIYRISIDKIQPKGDPYPYPYETGYAVGVAAKSEIPEIDQYVRLHKYSGGATISNSDQNKTFSEDALDILFVDKPFLKVFYFPLKLGKAESAFNDKFSIVITEQMAQKYFGSENPMGKILTVSGGVSPGSYTVTGILDPLPLNSHLQFNFLLPLENYMEYGWGGAATKNDDGWSSPDITTYITIEKSADIDLVNKKLNVLINKYRNEKNLHEGIIEKASLQPVGEIHLKSDPDVDQGLVRNNGNSLDITFFFIIAFFIVIIAWVNYINLSTARSIHRAKEVGVRKSVGALRKQLISQFLTEAIVVNSISACLAIGIAALALPFVNDIIQKEFDFTLVELPMFWIGYTTFIILGSLLSGFFPAFILSSFKPISMIGGYKLPKPGTFSLRSGLLTFQFLISLFLISATYLVYKQITFMKSQELGMDIEQILVLKGPEVNLDRSNLESVLEAFRKKIADHHSILAVAASSSVPGKGYNTGLGIRKLGDPADADKFGRVVFSGFGLPEAYNLEFLAGKSPVQDRSDLSPVPVVINEEAVHTFGLSTPENAIQEQLFFKGDTFKIAGVVRNFHWHSLADAHTPYLLEFYGDCRSYFSIKMNLSNTQESLTHIESVYNSFFPGNAFEYFFLEDEFNRQYQSDVQFGNLFFLFTVLAIFIASVGLFALVSYSATLRIKEIGVRKILGASTSSLMILLSKEYLRLLMFASIFAIPAVLFWGNSWLNNYAFKTGFSAELFIFPLGILTGISLSTVGYRALRAARTNPVDSLRTD